MATASEVSQRYDRQIEEVRQQLQAVIATAREVAAGRKDNWPSDGFGHHAAPGLALTWLCQVENDHVFLASDGTLWAGWKDEDGPSGLEPIVTDVHTMKLEWVQTLKSALDQLR